jgi:hypothetical protein
MTSMVFGAAFGHRLADESGAGIHPQKYRANAMAA